MLCRHGRAVNVERWLVVTVFKGLTGLVCRIDDEQLARIPQRGPLIVVMNHVSILEIPIMFTYLYPRPLTGFVRHDAWEIPFWRYLLNVCEAIPIRRGEADISAVRQGLELLEANHIVIIAPEGTRSGDGRLQRAQSGVVLLALRSGAPLLPVAYHGAEGFEQNLRHLKRTDFNIAVGKPFRLDAGGARVTRDVRQQMVDEMMFRIAALLPPQYRGTYSDLGSATEDYIVPSLV